jgi:hypothetical protein
MNRTLLLCSALLLLLSSSATAQDVPQRPAPRLTVGQVGLGYSIFDKQGIAADEADARGFDSTGGGTLRLGFVRHFAALPSLGLGGSVRGAFGTSAGEGGEYFFNPIFTSGQVDWAWSGEPHRGLITGLDIGFTNALAKQILTVNGVQSVEHEYGIGLGVGAHIGYRLPVSDAWSIDASLYHSRHFVDVQRPDASQKLWPFGVTSLVIGLAL